MTNKPMLSVERELLERITRLQLKRRDETVRRRAITELRALLDKEVDGDSHAPKKQGEPVAWLDKESGAIITAKLKPILCEDGFEIPLYAEQPAPVAVAHTMRSVMEITQEASQFYVPGTSNWCGHIANRLNGVKP